MRRAFLGIAVLVCGISAETPGQRAMEHVRKLCSTPRIAGTRAEWRAAEYVRRCLGEAGSVARIEPFDWSLFELQSAALLAEGRRYSVERVELDPFAGVKNIAGLAVVLDESQLKNRKSLEAAGIRNRIALVPVHAPTHILDRLGPRAIVHLKPEVLRSLRSGEVRLDIRGRVRRFRSPNVVAAGAPPTNGSAREVLITAHMDSVDCPGANDNASGVAVSLELARELRTRRVPMRIRYVAFGGEEFGWLGSRAYVRAHAADLGGIRFLFNIDSVGGTEEVFVETRGGVERPAKPCADPWPADLAGWATHDLGLKWSLLRRDLPPMVSNVPEWLRKAVSETGEALGCKIVSAQYMGSDHLTFAQAGVPATNVAFSGAAIHSSSDTPDGVSPQSLDTVIRLVLTVIEKAARE